MKDSDDVLKQMEKFNEEFFTMCEERHEMGADEYGPLNFLNVDLPQFIYEEIADMANYARFLYIRVRLMEETARERGFDLSAPFTREVRKDEVPSSTSTFVPRDKISGFLPNKK